MAVNSAPINYIPGTQIVQANTSEALDRFQIADFDAGSGTLIAGARTSAGSPRPRLYRALADMKNDCRGADSAINPNPRNRINLV